MGVFSNENATAHHVRDSQQQGKCSSGSLVAMDMDCEWNRLRQLYDEKSNEELVALYGSRDSLTQVAQEALEKTMKDRGLEAAEDTAEPEHDVGAARPLVMPDVLAPGERVLWTFDDMFQANRAVELMDGAELAYRLFDNSKGAAISQRYQPIAWLQLIVAEEDYAAARALLHEKMGLFPGREDGAPAAEAAPLSDVVGVLMFDAETELADGIAAATALATAGVTFVWHDGRDSPEGLADAMTVAIEVPEANFERAKAVVEAALAEDR